jgi:hypothetical protein
MALTPEQKLDRKEKAQKDKRSKESQQIRQNVVYSVLSAVMPKGKAMQLAGYSPKSKNLPVVVSRETVMQVRERLNNVAGCTLADQVGWYVSMREDEDTPASERLAAAKQIDKVLGYEAPQKVDVSQRYEIAGAVAVFHRLLSETKMRPSELAEFTEVEPPQPTQQETKDESRTA